MYLAPEIDKVLDDNKHKFIGELSYNTIVRRLGLAFDFPKDLKFKVEEFKDVDVNEFTVSGLYDMINNKKYIILNVSDEGKSLEFDEKTFSSFKFLISQTIQHESIHQNQWQHRDDVDAPIKLDFRNFGGTIEEEREYLADIDEIDAYAHDIVMEMKYYYPKEDPYKVLRRIELARKIPSYRYYKYTFKNCSWYKIKKHLFSKIYKWIPYV